MNLLAKKIHVEGKHSVADAESLLNTLLILNTFLIGFSINFASNQNYENLKSMDLRFLTIWYSEGTSPYFMGSNSDVVVMSALLAWRSITSLTFLNVAYSSVLVVL